MKTYNLIVYLNITLLYQVVDAENFEDIESSTNNNIKNIDLNTTLSNIRELLEKKSDFLSKYQCPTNATYCEDIHLSFPQLVKKYGYSVEEHEVKTSDGYLLTMFQIPNKGPPVLLVHGSTASCDDFVTIGVQAGLAYVLADAGFDVFLANCRGTKHSIRHATSPTDSAAFWDFTWDEMGRYDLPAFIDHILDTTNANDVKLIGHSQGTNAILTLCSEKPEYNDKVSVVILLSATAFQGHKKGPFSKLATLPIVPDFYLLAKSISLYSLFSDMEIGPIVKLLTNTFCATPETASVFCAPILAFAFGPDYDQVNITSLPVIFGHYPSPISIKATQHYNQITKSGKFARYDYGKELNLKKYGSLDPPEYPLYKVKTKVAICWAENDILCTEEDLQILLHKLPNVIDVYKVPYEKFTHSDYIFAKDVKSLLYDKVLEILKSN